MATLVYAGAGWDSDFLNCIQGYERYILFDALPAKPHYTPEQAGYSRSRDSTTFFETLCDAFGTIVKHDREENIICFENNIEYHYSMNADDFLQQGHLPADADILLRGFIPETWRKRGVFEKHTTFVACDTACDFGVAVHLPDDDTDCDDCFCCTFVDSNSVDTDTDTETDK
jgi:hypothetical protein